MWFGLSGKRPQWQDFARTDSNPRWVLCIVTTLVVLAACRLSLAADDLPNSKTVVVGTVTDAQGQPVADATVYVVVPKTSNMDVTVAKATTQADGTWSIELDQPPTLGNLTALVRKDGYAIGVATSRSERYPGINVAPTADGKVDLQVQLQSERTVQFRVQDAEGNAINDAKVFLQGMFQEGQAVQFYWQRPLIRELSWSASADGLFTVDGIPPDQTLMFSIETDTGESQFGYMRRAGLDQSEPSVIKLLPTCNVEVQLVADDPLLRNDRMVTLESRRAISPEGQTALNDSGPQLVGTMATLQTDESGKATAVVAAGDISIFVQPQSGDTAFAVQPTQVKAEAGETKQFEIPLVQGIRVTGSVVTETGEPIEGVLFSVQFVSVPSKADGTFVASIPLTGPRYGSIVSIPPGFAMPLESHLRIPQETAVGNVGGQAAAGEAKIAELTLPPIVLRRASMLSGTVRDETGEPVSGAIVTASWIQQENTISSLRSDTTATDAAGKFELTRVYPQVDALVTATTSDKSVMQATAVNSSQPMELELTVTSEGMLPIVGVIQGADGVAVANPIIKVTRAMTAPSGHNYGTHVVEWSDSREIVGGDVGRFESPGMVARLGKYSFSISAPGYLSTETPFLDPPTSGATWQLDPITLTKARNVRGLVRDSSGQPLAGATVSSWPASADRNRSREIVQSATTDASGRFVLTDLHPAAPLAFVKLEGYRPSGTALTDDNQDVQLTLYRDEESIATEHRVAPGLLQDDRHRAAAIRLMEAMLPEQRGSNHFHGELLNMMLRVDPNLVVAELSEVKSADARARLLVQLGEVDDALAEVETIEDGYMRTYCRLELCQHIEDADERREFLAAALVDAQTITRPDRRAVIVASIAEKFAELGDNDRVATILREELPQVQALSTQEWPGFARGYFAAQFARVEPETALEMASEAPPDEQVRHYQNVAHVLGNVNPELAEQTLGRITNNRYVNSPVVRVVYRMASVDLERAIRLAEGIQDHSWPGERSRGLGVIAWAIRQEQPEKARGLLRQAFAALPDSRASQHSHASATFGAAMDLLRWAEQIDPERLTDYFWTTVSHFGGMSGGAWSPDQAMEADAEQQSQLVLLLSLYSIAPDVPRQLIAPGFEYWESQIGEQDTRFTDGQGTFMAMALSDPERAVDFAVRFHQGLDAEHRRYIPQPWEVIGHALTRNRDELSEAITRDVFHRWVVDKFDL